MIAVYMYIAMLQTKKKHTKIRDKKIVKYSNENFKQTKSVLNILEVEICKFK